MLVEKCKKESTVQHKVFTYNYTKKERKTANNETSEQVTETKNKTKSKNP